MILNACMQSRAVWSIMHEYITTTTAWGRSPKAVVCCGFARVHYTHGCMWLQQSSFYAAALSPYNFQIYMTQEYFEQQKNDAQLQAEECNNITIILCMAQLLHNMILCLPKCMLAQFEPSTVVSHTSQRVPKCTSLTIKRLDIILCIHYRIYSYLYTSHLAPLPDVCLHFI